MNPGYNTPPQPPVPVQPDLAFIPADSWTVQLCMGTETKVNLVARRNSWMAAYEFARGFIVAAGHYQEQINGPGHTLFVVGPDGKMYAALREKEKNK